MSKLFWFWMGALFAAVMLGCAEEQTSIPTAPRAELPKYGFNYWYKATNHYGDYGIVIELWAEDANPFGAVYSTEGEIYQLRYGTDFKAIVKEPRINNYKKWGVDRIVLEIDGYTSVWYSVNGYTTRDIWHTYSMRHHMRSWDGHIPDLITEMIDEGILYKGSRFGWYYMP